MEFKLIKKDERKLHYGNTLNSYKKNFGAVLQSKGRYMKHKEFDYGAIKGTKTVHLDICYVEIKNEQFGIDDKFYVVGDTLGRICFSGEADFNEIKNWLNEKGYKTEKQFYIEEEGMSPEDYEEWCNA